MLFLESEKLMYFTLSNATQMLVVIILRIDLVLNSRPPCELWRAVILSLLPSCRTLADYLNSLGIRFCMYKWKSMSILQICCKFSQDRAC